MGRSVLRRWAEPSDPMGHAELSCTALIVAGGCGRHGLWRLLDSTANGVLRSASCDVLGVRAAAEPTPTTTPAEALG